MPEAALHRLIVCQHLEQEVKIILQTGGFEDFQLHSYPPACSQHKLRQQVLNNLSEIDQNEGNNILIGGCFSSSPEQLSQAMPNAKIHHCEQCFLLLSSQTLIEKYQKTGAYLLTPSWLARWRTHLANMGLSQATARSLFSESTTRLVLLDTGIDPDSAEILAEFAEYLDLPYKVLPIGLDYFRLVIAQIILEWRLENTRQEKKIVSEQSRKKVADQAMAFDLLAGLTSKRTEEDVIKQIMELFTMIIAPQQMIYASVVNDRVKNIYAYHTSPPSTEYCQAWLDQERQEDIRLDADNGFYLRMTNQDQVLGLLEFKEITFPKYQREYLPFAVTMAKLCGLAIMNARLFEEIQQLANTDYLTGLNNRRLFFSQAEIEFERSRRYDRPLSAMLLDIDHFKTVNDTYGHAVGDQVLVEVAECCKNSLRIMDIQGRYGGEEFVFVLPETTEAGARQVAERLRQEIADLIIMVEGQRLNVTVSIGLASFDASCPSLEELLIRSDKALYAAKGNGRNRVCVYGDDPVSPPSSDKS